ncbi:unnamed protein product [Prorocentrum cordatum]|uniref:Uncharacterized protein n=1 Tax=Prorocentrum cordatum TaxID=2364126 RepID=A0ABN9XJX1_9DINO|nr:unnamed protein product [Polarella glacialis]
MYQRLCGKTLSKVLQRSDWGAEQLSQEQVEYSARDAVAALEIMHSFKDRWMPRAADVGSFARMFEDSFEVDEDGDLQRAELSDARARVLGQQDLPGPTRRAVLESKSGRDGGGGRWARARTKRAAVKFYAVAAGHVPGVYSTREECRAQCENFYGARYKSFTTRGQAEAFVIDHG